MTMSYRLLRLVHYLMVSLLIFLLFAKTAFGTEEATTANAAGEEAEKMNRDLMSSSAQNNSNGADIPSNFPREQFEESECFDAENGQGGDKYAITRLNNAGECMLITDEKDIPEADRGKKTFGESCDGRTAKCRAYVKTIRMVNGKEHICLKPTHLTCHPGEKVCKCTDDGMVINEMRFQFGSDRGPGKNISIDRCLIRPTFDVIPGFDCAPRTKQVRIYGNGGGDDDDTGSVTTVCGCNESSSINDIETKNEDWWEWPCDKVVETSGQSPVSFRKKRSLEIGIWMGVFFLSIDGWITRCVFGS